MPFATYLSNDPFLSNTAIDTLKPKKRTKKPHNPKSRRKPFVMPVKRPNSAPDEYLAEVQASITKSANVNNPIASDPQPFWRCESGPANPPEAIAESQRRWARSASHGISKRLPSRLLQPPPPAPAHLSRPGLKLSITLSAETDLREVLWYLENSANAKCVHTLILRPAGSWAGLRDDSTNQTSATRDVPPGLTALLDMLENVRTLHVDGSGFQGVIPLGRIVKYLKWEGHNVQTLRLHRVVTTSEDVVKALRGTKPNLLHVTLSNVYTTDGNWAGIFASLATIRLKSLKLMELCCLPDVRDAEKDAFAFNFMIFADNVCLANDRESVAARLKDLKEFSAVGRWHLFGETHKS